MHMYSSFALTKKNVFNKKSRQTFDKNKKNALTVDTFSNFLSLLLFNLVT